MAVKKEKHEPKNIEQKPAQNAQPVVQPSAQNKNDTVKISKNALIVVSIIIIIAAIAAVYLVFVGKQEIVETGTTVKYGDTVSVMYTGKFENGTIFDTNNEVIAQSAGIERSSFEPLVFVAGQGQLIAGFKTAVLGMRIGEKKTVTLEPAQAYGEYDPALILEIPRVQEINRTITINKTFVISNATFAIIFSKSPVLGDVVTENQEQIDYNVTKIDKGNVTIESVVSIGQNIMLFGTAWNSTVTAIGKSNITLIQNPVEGQIIDTSVGESVVSLTPDKIKIRANVIVGNVVRTTFYTYVIKAFDEETITLDANSPFAGKRLVFEIEVLNITQTNSTA